MSDPYNLIPKKTSYTYDQLAQIRRDLVKEKADIQHRAQSLERAVKALINSKGSIEYLVALENLAALVKDGAGNE
jgi:uncharacterized protein YydD (DUF2326 family)